MLKQHANVIPSGLPTLLEGFSRATLKKRPSNLGFFAWYYFTELIKYETENELFDLKNLVREFHKHMAHRISGDGFEEELKKEGYTVTSNVNHDYNELYISGEVDLFSWRHQCDDTNNMQEAKPDLPAKLDFPDTSNNPRGAAEDTHYKVHTGGNQKPRMEKGTCPSVPSRKTKRTDVSTQSKMQNNLDTVPSHPQISQPMKDAAFIKTRPTKAPKQAQNLEAKGTAATACVHPLKDAPRNQTNATTAKLEASLSACSITDATQKNNLAAATRESVPEQCSFQLREMSLGTSNSTTDYRKRWALYVSRDGNHCPCPPNSPQSQSQPQQQPQPKTGQSGISWWQQPEAFYHHPTAPYGPPSEPCAWYPPGPVWCPPPPHLPPYPLWPPPGPCLYPWGPPCPCVMWLNMGWGEPGVPRGCHTTPGCPPRASAPDQAQPSPRQNALNSSDSISAPDPLQLPVDEQSSTGFPRSLYPPAFGYSPFNPGPMPLWEAEMPSSNAPNWRFPYNPNSHIHPKFNQQI